MMKCVLVCVLTSDTRWRGRRPQGLGRHWFGQDLSCKAGSRAPLTQATRSSAGRASARLQTTGSTGDLRGTHVSVWAEEPGIHFDVYRLLYE